MPDSIVTQDTQGQELDNSISSFFLQFHIGMLLRKCNAAKEKGFSVTELFKYKFCNAFQKSSMYMQQKTGAFRERFSKNTYYRFLNDSRINWMRFTTLLSKEVADTIEPLTDAGRINAFVIDDSLFERTSCGSTELGSRVFDHTVMQYKKGYRMMTCGWTDGNTFLPINSCLLASSEEKNLYCAGRTFDGRSLAAKRRKLAQTKGTTVMLELLQTAMTAGHHADYVLFDTWFSSPAQLMAIKELGLDAIAMIKRNANIHYWYKGQSLSIDEIFNQCKKRRGRSRYLLSVNVSVTSGGKKIPAKIVCLRNRSNRKKWVAFISTDPDLSEDEIIRIYGKRWQIEVFFKASKSYLQLTTECHSLSYDALTAHVTIVFARYLMIALEQRRDKDLRTLGQIFYFLTDELADITFIESAAVILKALFTSIEKVFQPTDEQMHAFIVDFVDNIPGYIRLTLRRCCYEV